MSVPFCYSIKSVGLFLRSLKQSARKFVIHCEVAERGLRLETKWRPPL